MFELPWVQSSQRLVTRWRRLAECHGVPICFGWAVAEATFWPVIPDIALFLLILAVPRRSLKLLTVTIAGTTLGGALTLLLASQSPSLALDAVLHIPLVHAQSVAVLHDHLTDWSLPHAFLFQPWSGIPFKLWAVLAVATGHGPLQVVPWFVAGRSLRFAAVACVAFILGVLLDRKLPDLAIPLGLVFGPAGALAFYQIAIAG